MAPGVRRPGRPTNDGTPGLDRAACAKAMMATTWPEWSLKTRCRYGSEDDFARFTGYSYRQLEAGMLDAIRRARSQQPVIVDLNELKDLSVTLFKKHYTHLMDGGPKRRASVEARPDAYDQDMHIVVKHLFAKLRYASVRGTSSVKQALARLSAEEQKTKKLLVVLKATPSTSTSPTPIGTSLAGTHLNMLPPNHSQPHATNNPESNVITRPSAVKMLSTSIEPPIPRRVSERLHGRSSSSISQTIPHSSLAMLAAASRQTNIRERQPASILSEEDCQPWVYHFQTHRQSATRKGSEMIITSFMRSEESVDLVVECNGYFWHLNEGRASRLSEFFRGECQKQEYNFNPIKRVDMSTEAPITVHAILQFIHEMDYDFLTDPNDTLHVPQEVHADYHLDIAEVANKYDKTFQLCNVAEQKFIAVVDTMESRQNIADLITKVYKERSSDNLRAAIARHCLKYVTEYTHNQAFWKIYTSNSSFAIKFLQAVSQKEESDAQRAAMAGVMTQASQFP